MNLDNFHARWNILESVVLLQGTIHELHQRKKMGVIFKVDFGKGCDKMKWPFLFQTLGMQGFSAKQITWVESFISSGSVAVM